MKYTTRRFYRVKLFLLTATLVLLALAAINTYYYLNSKHPQKITTKETAIRQTLKTTDSAVSAAQDYFTQRIDRTDTAQRLFLDYLYRKFHITDQFNAQKVAIPNSATIADIRTENDAMMRMAYPLQLVKSLGKNPSTIAIAANCDRIQPPKDFNNRLAAEVDEGGYALTHVVLAMRFMTENKCQLPSNSEQLLSSAYEALIKNATDTSISYDLKYESIAFLLSSDRKNAVQKGWIEQVISEQNPDGGWPVDQQYKESDQHPTLLALWALLEYSQPNASPEPLIYHPTP
jgi:hypothetical protein